MSSTIEHDPAAVEAPDPPADWYPDHTDPQLLRYWDGTAWTDHTAPAPATAPAPPTASAPAADWYTDRADTQLLRYWDGARWTDHTAPAPGATPGPTVPTASSSQARSTTQQPTAGDSVLKLVSTLTLNSFIMKKMAEAFYVPQLVEIVQSDPSNPTYRLWLGLRLEEMDITNSRINRSRVPVSAVGFVTRPVTRRVARALASDRAKAHDRVLESAFGLANRRVAGPKVDPAALLVLARIYLAKGDPRLAWELVALLATRPCDPAAYYVAAEAAYTLGHIEHSRLLARKAWDEGCTLGYSLLNHDAAQRRARYLSTEHNYLWSPTTAGFWKAKEAYYEHAEPEHLWHFFGPSCLTPDLEHDHG